MAHLFKIGIFSQRKLVARLHFVDIGVHTPAEAAKFISKLMHEHKEDWVRMQPINSYDKAKRFIIEMAQKEGEIRFIFHSKDIPQCKEKFPEYNYFTDRSDYHCKVGKILFDSIQVFPAKDYFKSIYSEINLDDYTVNFLAFQTVRPKDRHKIPMEFKKTEKIECFDCGFNEYHWTLDYLDSFIGEKFKEKWIINTITDKAYSWYYPN